MTKRYSLKPSKLTEESINKTIANDEINLREMFSAIWSKKWIVVLSTVFFSLGAIAYSLQLPNIYKSDILLAPTNNSGNSNQFTQMASQLGGIVNLSGINLGSGQSDAVKLAIQILQSRQFIDNFISKHKLIVPLMASKNWDLRENALIYNDKLYDINTNKWLRKPKGLRGSKPTAQEAYRKFIKQILSVENDKSTGLYTLSISFYSPFIAQKWATWLVEDINEVMRKRTIREVSQNLTYLKTQLGKTSIADMQTMFYKLIEEQTKKMMLAEVDSEFIFKIIDPAVVSETKSSPKRGLICVLGTILGFLIGVTITLILLVIKKSKLK